MFTRLLIFVLSLLSTSAPLIAQWQWVDNSQSSANYERVEDVAVDETRSVIYSVGFVTGNPSFPEISAASLSGGDDGFVMKYDLNGNVIWAFPIGGSGNDRVHGVAVDEATGNVYITGYIRGSYASNGTKLTGISGGISGNVTGTSGNDDAFVACYDVFGHLVWYKIIGGSSVDRGMDIDVNASGVFMTGIYTNNGILSTLVPILPVNGEVNNFVLALDASSGNTLWDAVLASTDDDFNIPSSNDDIKRTGISADANGVYVVTYFQGATYRVYNSSDVLSASIADPNNSEEDFVVTSYTNAGAHNWSVLYDNPQNLTFGLDIANDCSGVYVSGALHNGGVTPGGTVISSIHDDFILSKLNKSNGNEIWVKEFNSSTNHDDHFVGIEADGYGNLYAVGRLRGTQVSMGSEINYTGGVNEDKVMIAHFFTNGAFQSFEVLPGSDDSWAMSIATYKNEKYTIGGYYNGNLTFGTITPASNVDNAFIATRTIASSISYASTSGNVFAGSAVFCQSEGNVIPDLRLPSGGVFTAPVQVALVNASTGEIDLAASTPGGPYTISYSAPASVCAGGSFTATIYITAQEDASFTYVDNTFCKNQPNPTPASVAIPGGTFSGPPQLVFANATTGEINLAASTVGGPYYLVYSTPGSYCPGSDSIQVYVSNAPDPSFGYSNSSYCGGSGTTTPTFTISTGGVFSAPPGVIFVSTSTGEIDLNASTPGGPYAIQYTVSNGTCVASSTFNISIIQPDDASFSYPSYHLCTNDPNTLPLTVANPGGVFFAPTGLIVSNASTGEISPNSSTIGGPYQLYYTTSGGACPGTDSMEFYIEPLPDATFAYAQTLYCSGSGTVLPSSIATAGGTFSAPTGIVFVNTTTGEIDLNSSTVGGPYIIQYVVTNTYCQNSHSFTLFIEQTEDASFTYVGEHFCNNEPNPSAATVAMPGGRFSGPSELVFANTTTGEIDVAASTVGGPYYLVYTTSGINCPSSDSIQVFIEAAPDATFSYAQSSYCSDFGTIIPSSIATTGGTFSAPAGIALVNSATGEIDINASTVGGPYTIQYLVSTIYCQEIFTFDITIIQTEDASFTYTAEHFCTNEPNPVPASIATSGGTFSGPAGLSVNPTTGEIDVVASTVGGPYWLIYSLGGACPVSDSIQVYIEAAPDATFSYTQSSYCSDFGTIIPSSIATTGGTFSAPAGIALVNSATGEIDINASTVGGPYTIQYLVSTIYCQEIFTFDITIIQTEEATFSYSTDHFCQNEPNPVPTSIATAGGTFSAPPGLILANSSTGEIDVAASTPGGPYDVTYTTNNSTCPDSDIFQVYIESAPDASFSYPQTLFCAGSGTVLPSSVISPGGTFTGPSQVVFLDPTTGKIDLNASTVGGPYTIQYEASNAYCQESATFTITIAEQDVVESLSYGPFKYCVLDDDQSPIVVGTSGGVFSAEAGIGLLSSSTGLFSPQASLPGGTYLVKYVSPGVCPDSADFSITIYDVVTADAGADQELDFIFSTDLQAIVPMNGSGIWTTSSSAQIMDISDPKSFVSSLSKGDNTFTWTVSNDVCPSDSDDVLIHVNDLFIPQAVTPNGDGKNDFFELLSIDEVTCDLQIFNRWGQIVYENKNYQNEWFGQNSKGEELVNDTYFYVILIDDSISYNGYIVLKK